MSDVQRVWDMIADIDICMFVTRTAAGMHGRPMSSIPKKDEGVVYFLTAKSTIKDDEIAADDRVHLGYSKGQQHLSVAGTASLLDNRALIERLWNPGAQAFWPNGPQDPDIIAIAVRPDGAEYWDGPNALVAGVRIAMALVRGTTPDMGENEKVRM